MGEKRRKYTREFKVEAIRLIEGEGRRVSGLSSQLELCSVQTHKSKNLYRKYGSFELTTKSRKAHFSQVFPLQMQFLPP